MPPPSRTGRSLCALAELDVHGREPFQNFEIDTASGYPCASPASSGPAEHFPRDARAAAASIDGRLHLVDGDRRGRAALTGSSRLPATSRFAGRGGHVPSSRCNTTRSFPPWRRQPGEGNVWEKSRSGLVSFPFASVSLHAACLRCSESSGSWWPTGLERLCYYLVVLAFCAFCTPRRCWPTAWPFSSPSNIFEIGVANTFGSCWRTCRTAFRGYRIPRPFITEIHFVACMALCLWILGRPEARQPLDLGRWEFSGSAAARRFPRLPGDGSGNNSPGRREHCYEFRGLAGFGRCLVTCGALFLATSSVFWVQRFEENPDVPRRLGMFAVPRGQMWQLGEGATLQKCLEAAAFLAGFSFLMRRVWKQPSHGIRTLALACLAILAYEAIFVLGFALGKGIQLYQFVDRLTGIVSYCWIALLGYLIESFCVLVITLPLGKWTGRLERLAPAGLKALVLGVAIAGILLSFHEKRMRPNVQHMRLNLYPELTHYRDDFAAMTAELSRPEYAGYRVLATLDHQVFAWWVAFHKGYTFVPDPFSTTVPDAEIERRIAWFLRDMNVSTATFEEFLHSRMFRTMWLGHDKYQCSKAYQFAPLEDYDPSALEAYQKSSVLDSWVQAVPLSEQRRLVHLFEGSPGSAELGDHPRLDLIVSSHSPPLPGPKKANSSWSITMPRSTCGDEQMAVTDR